MPTAPGCFCVSARFFGIPSYHVQRMLSAHLGTAHLAAEVADGGGGQNSSRTAADTLAASASCLTDACDQVGQGQGQVGQGRALAACTHTQTHTLSDPYFT